MKTVNQISISHVSALALVNKAVECATAINITISACVVDMHGRVKAKVTMDGTSIIADELVEKKARTALLGLSSSDFAGAVKDAPDIAQSMLQLPQITLLGGGYPLYEQGKLVGAFAVGGAMVDQDMACAEQVLAALNTP
jgi:uncharacterized protein GlcG (DUF336 family)